MNVPCLQTVLCCRVCGLVPSTRQSLPAMMRGGIRAVIGRRRESIVLGLGHSGHATAVHASVDRSSAHAAKPSTAAVSSRVVTVRNPLNNYSANMTTFHGLPTAAF